MFTGVGSAHDSDGFVECGAENDTLSISVLTEVRYGTGASFNFDTVSSDITCDNAQFGDPIFGFVKHCDCRVIPDADGDGVEDGDDVCPGRAYETETGGPEAYGDVCVSNENACGETNDGTINCKDKCSAKKPKNPDADVDGIFDCDDVCVDDYHETDDGGPEDLGEVCTSEANECGDTADGEILCDGSCDAETPVAVDTDEDGTPDCNDRFPNDFDNDGVDDKDDNCPDVHNSGQADVDDDGLGNKCDDEDDRPRAKIIAHKIICDDESYLPNWGDGGPNIDKNTAKDFIDEHGENCRFAEDRSFQR